MSRFELHDGERQVQTRLGVHERMAPVMAQVIGSAMPEQHRELFRRLPSLLVGSLDEQGRPWASVLAGAPGFVHAPDARHLRVDALPLAEDPWRLRAGTPLGLLGLEPRTRRRNRLNGTVVTVDTQGFTVAVDQSFGNCPKYIQARTPTWVERGPPLPARAEGGLLSDAALSIARSADTLFIASASAAARAHGGAEGVDLSHRGGLPGFVRVTESQGRTVLSLPDYAGNNFFNTLGNLFERPCAGLLFIDPNAGHLLQLTGHAEIVWGGPEVAEIPGARRVVRVTVEAGWWRPHALPLRWSEPVFAPQSVGPPGA